MTSSQKLRRCACCEVVELAANGRTPNSAIGGSISLFTVFHGWPPGPGGEPDLPRPHRLRQVRSIAAILASDQEAAIGVELTLPETGACGGL